MDKNIISTDYLENNYWLITSRRGVYGESVYKYNNTSEQEISLDSNNISYYLTMPKLSTRISINKEREGTWTGELSEQQICLGEIPTVEEFKMLKRLLGIS